MKRAKCLTPSCGKVGTRSRGLCESCYQDAWRMVKHQKASWKQLEAMGLCRPPRPGKRPSKFSIAARSVLAKSK